LRDLILSERANCYVEIIEIEATGGRGGRAIVSRWETQAALADLRKGLDVWYHARDMTEALRKMQHEGSHTAAANLKRHSSNWFWMSEYLIGVVSKLFSVCGSIFGLLLSNTKRVVLKT